MHSLPPIAGITCVVGIERRRRSGARRSEATASRNSARPRLEGYWCVHGSCERRRPSPRRCGRASAGRGRRSRARSRRCRRPCVRAIFRSSSANRYGGIRSSRLDVPHRRPRACATNSSENSPAKTGSAQPVSVTSSSSPTATSSSPPSRLDRHGARRSAQDGRDRGGRCAGSGARASPPRPRSKIRARTSWSSRSG